MANDFQQENTNMSTGTAARRGATTGQGAFALASAGRVDQAVGDTDRNARQVRRASALDLMAARLNIEPARLKATLQATVFRVKMPNDQYRSCSDEEFAALIIVANEYRLNPLTKQIYAFPAKGGGIVPVVSVDGWIFLMNSHPEFDGIEFNDLPDEKGNLFAIEAIIWRKDRARPTKIPEYLAECKRGTAPWKDMPARMLRHKALIQCARVAFGLGGIRSELDDDVIDGTIVDDQSMRTVTPPRRDDPPHDAETGEVIDEPSSVQTDARGREIDPRETKAEEIIARAGQVDSVDAYNALAEEAQPHVDAMPDEDMAGACNRALREARRRVTAQ